MKDMKTTLYQWGEKKKRIKGGKDYDKSTGRTRMGIEGHLPTGLVLIRQFELMTVSKDSSPFRH